MSTNACLGLSWLGNCAHDPSIPSPLYFTPGDAIAALAFTLAVATFLKPIYRLRLAVRYLSLGRLYGLVFLAFVLTVFAALVPNLPFLRGSILGYPIYYELLAAILFVTSYGAVALAVVRPIRISERRLERFAIATADMLSSASDTDHIDLLPDLRRSLPRLISLASFVESPKGKVSAFYLFTHRRQIERASYAVAMLRILADPPFCRSLVSRTPWAVARLMNEISDKQLYAKAAEGFVREIASQAIEAEEGMMAREVSYTGFGTAPALSESLFSNYFIVTKYNPIQRYFPDEVLTPGIVKRFNAAAKRCYDTLIENKHFDHANVSYGIREFYHSVGRRVWELRSSGDERVALGIEYAQGVRAAIGLAHKLLGIADRESYDCLFLTSQNDRRHDPLHDLADVVFEALSCVSKGFKGYTDQFWYLAVSVIMEAYPNTSAQPNGMNPFQQRLAVKLIDKVRDNVSGYYPAVCRVLLATVGPFNQPATQPNMTAFNILRNSLYAELRRMPQLASQKPDKIGDFLPDNVTLDVQAATLIHVYAGGSTAVTDLNTITVAEIDLFDPKYRREPSAEERAVASVT